MTGNIETGAGRGNGAFGPRCLLEALLLAGALAPSACGAPADHGEPAGHVGGACAALALATTLVLKPALAGAQETIDLPGEDRPLVVTAEQLFVGHANPDGWRVLGRTNRWLRSLRRTLRPGETRTSSGVRLGFDAEGHLYVLDPGTWRIYIVDPEGTLVREYSVPAREATSSRWSSAPASLGVAPDGSFAVCDFVEHACRVYSPGGELERVVSFGDSEGYAGAADHFRSNRTSTAFLNLGDLGGAWVIERAVLEGPEVETHDLASAWSPPGRPKGVGSAGSTMTVSNRPDSPEVAPSVTVSLGNPFVPVPHYDALPGGGFAFVDSTTHVVKVASADGQVHRILRRPLVPQPISEEMRAAERREMRRRAESIAKRFPQAEREAVGKALLDAVDEAYFHDEMAVVGNLMSTWEGGLWVRRNGEEPEDGPPRGPIDVLAPDGSYVGTIDPKSSDGLVSTLRHGRAAFGPDGLIAFIEDAPSDATYVVLKRLPPEVRQ